MFDLILNRILHSHHRKKEHCIDTIFNICNVYKERSKKVLKTENWKEHGILIIFSITNYISYKCIFWMKYKQARFCGTDSISTQILRR